MPRTLVERISNFLRPFPEEEKPATSIIERLEGLVPPVHLIESSYKLDRRIAEAGHKAMLSIEVLLKEVLVIQQRYISESKGLLDQQSKTAGIIDKQVNQEEDSDTIIRNIRIALSQDDVSAEYILDNMLTPVFARAFRRLRQSRQRELFAALRESINDLLKEDGVLLEP